MSRIRAKDGSACGQAARSFRSYLPGIWNKVSECETDGAVQTIRFVHCWHQRAMTPDDLDALHDYWFGHLSGRDHFPGDRFPLWFDNTPGRDSELRQRFAPLLAGAP